MHWAVVVIASCPTHVCLSASAGFGSVSLLAAFQACTLFEPFALFWSESSPFLISCWSLVHGVDLHRFAPGLLTIPRLDLAFAVVLNFGSTGLLQLSFIQSVVQSHNNFDEFAESVWSLLSCQFILEAFLEPLVILSDQRVLVPV